MSVSLQKGQKVSLKKSTGEGLTKMLVGLGWDVKEFDGGADFDLDASVFMLGENGKCPTDNEFIFYGNLEHSSGAVKHMGDNTVGGSDGDDEQVFLDLSKMPDRIKEVVFSVTIYDAEKRNQNFGMVSNAYLRILDESNGDELVRYDLSEDYSIMTALVVGKVYRSPDGDWRFAAIGDGFSKGLAALCGHYGIDAE